MLRHGMAGSIGGIQVCESPASQPSMFDSVSSHIPLKIKEKVWTGEYIDMSLMLKSGKDLVYDSQLNGELAVKGGQLTVLQQKHNQIKNIHTWDEIVRHTKPIPSLTPSKPPI
jgi:hypothetical protein